MRKFNVRVNGIPYYVEIEETQSAGAVFVNNTQPVAAVMPVVEAPQPVSETAAIAPPQAAAPVAEKPQKGAAKSGAKLSSPMPGTVIKIIAKDGKTVKKGETVLVLESMKMENDIVANADGVISYEIQQGASVNSGDILAIIG